MLLYIYVYIVGDIVSHVHACTALLPTGVLLFIGFSTIHRTVLVDEFYIVSLLLIVLPKEIYKYFTNIAVYMYVLLF